MALNPIRLTAIQQSQPIVQDKEGRPSTYFVRVLNDLFGRLAGAINALIENQNATADAQQSADAAQGFAEAAQLSADNAEASAAAASGQATAAQATADSALSNAATAQGQADAALALAGTKVTKDQTPAPAYSIYAGQTVSNPPTQAEVQAQDDALVALSAAFASTIAKLQTIDVFS